MISKLVVNKKSIFIFCSFFLISCTPTVKVETPQEPITINLNVKLDAEVKVKLDKETDALIKNNEELF